VISRCAATSTAELTFTFREDFNQPTVVEADRRGVAQATGVDIEGLDESPVRQKRAMANRQ
jgi:type 1 fimbria pilin